MANLRFYFTSIILPRRPFYNNEIDRIINGIANGIETGFYFLISIIDWIINLIISVSWVTGIVIRIDFYLLISIINSVIDSVEWMSRKEL